MAGETQDFTGWVIISLEKIEEVLLPYGFRKMKVEGKRQHVYGKVYAIDSEKVSCRLYTNLIGKKYTDPAMCLSFYWKPRPDWDARQVGMSQFIYRGEHWEGNMRWFIDALEAGKTVIHPTEDRRTILWCRCPKPGCNWPLHYSTTYYSKKARRQVGRVFPFWTCSRYPRCKIRLNDDDITVVDGTAVATRT